MSIQHESISKEVRRILFDGQKTMICQMCAKEVLFNVKEIIWEECHWSLHDRNTQSPIDPFKQFTRKAY